jgi:hypothetical protein
MSHELKRRIFGVAITHEGAACTDLATQARQTPWTGVVPGGYLLIAK